MAEKEASGVQANLDEEEKPGKYPIGATLILFFEIFRSYASGANRSVSMLLLDVGGYNQDQGTQIFHTSMSIATITPISAALLADSWTGKYPVLLIGCAITSLGIGLITIASVPGLNVSVRTFIWLGVVLRSIGWGCMHPTMTPLGADQFDLPRQKKYLSQYFSWNHLIVNVVILTAVFLTTSFRADVHCLGETHCYALAFLIPTLCVVIMLFGFILTKQQYKLYTPSKKTVVLSVVACIFTAIGNKIKMRKQPDNVPRAHWLHYAKEKYGDVFVEEVRSILCIMLMCLPTMLVWCVYMQYESRWVYQATRLDLRVGDFLMKPEHIIIINSLMVVCLVPILTLIIYPLFDKIAIKRPLIKTLLGSILIAVSFLLSGVLELLLERRMAPQLASGIGQFRLYNGMECNYTFNNLPGDKLVELQKFGYYEDTNIKVTGKQNFLINYTPGADCPDSMTSDTFSVEIQEEMSKAYLFSGSSSSFSYQDVVNNSENGYPYFRMLADNLNDTIVIKNDRYTVLNDTLQNNDIQVINPGIFDVIIGGELVKSNFELLMGGHYVFLVKKIKDNFELTIHLIKDTNYYSIYVQLPQLFLLSTGEIMFMLQMREFVYGETPATLTTFMWAFNELMDGFGNIVTVIFANTESYRLSSQIFVYSGALFFDCLIFGFLICRYKYVNPIWA